MKQRETGVRATIPPGEAIAVIAAIQADMRHGLASFEIGPGAGDRTPAGR